MAFTGAGIYAPNEGDVDVGRIVEIVKSPAGDGAVVLMAHQAGKNDALKKVRESMPDAVIQIRRYVADWTTETPRECAARFVEVMERFRPWTDHGTWANEQNLAAESAGKIGASPTRLMPWSDWQRVAAFNEETATEVDRLAPWIVRHYPGYAYGHGEDWGYDGNHNPMPGFPLVDGVPTPAYELCRPGIDLCHILNHHPYVQRGAPVMDEWVGVRRIEKTIALFPGKTLFVAETGDFDVQNPQAPDRILQIAYYLQGLRPVLGWCFFILDSPDPGHAMNNWSLNRAIEAKYREMTRFARPRSWSAPIPPKEPTVPDVVLSVSERHSHAADDNWGKGDTFGPCAGVIVHSTGGEASILENEYIGTVNWFMTPDAGVSAQRIVGAGAFQEVNTSVHDGEVAWHARDPHNHRRRGIEFAHPDTPVWNTLAYPDFQYEAGGELIARWKIADDARGWNWPIRLLTRAELAANPSAPGIAYHRDTPQGIADGKRDPTGPFDGPKLIAAAQRWYAKLTTPPPQPGKTFPDGRPIPTTADYDEIVWGPAKHAANALISAAGSLRNGGDRKAPGDGGDADALNDLALKAHDLIKTNEQRHGVRR